MNQETQASLILRLKNGEFREAAWHEFWEKYRDIVFFWAKRLNLSDDDADEIVSRVMTKLVQKMPSFEYDPNKKFRSWLKTVTRNTVFDFLSQISRTPGAKGKGNIEDGDQCEIEGNPEDQLVEELNSSLEIAYAAQMRVLESVKSRVNPITWKAFWMTAVEGLTGKEVSDGLGVPVASVYMAKSRVTNMLRAEAKS